MDAKVYERSGFCGTVCDDWRSKLQRWLPSQNTSKEVGKSLLILFVLLTVGFLSIILADANYVDDEKRIPTGLAGWGMVASRYLADILAYGVHTSTFLADVSPLTQFIAIFEMALASLVLLHICTGRLSYSCWEYLAVVPLSLSPFFLQCMSYKYDAPYMAFSVLVSLVPFLLVDANKKRWFCCAAFLGAIAMCCTYQASSGIALMMTVYLAVAWKLQGRSAKTIVGFCTQSIVSFAAALLFYRVFMVRGEGVGTSLAVQFPDVLFNVANNYSIYISQTIRMMKGWWLVAVGVIFVGYLVVMMKRRTPSQKPLAAFGIIVIGAVCMGALSYGIYPIFENPTYTPRCMYGFGLFVSLLTITVASGRHLFLCKIAVGVLAWALISFSYMYGNALQVQNEWMHFRADYAVQRMAEIDLVMANEEVRLQITGTIGYAPALEETIDRNPMLSSLVPVTLQGPAWGGRQHLLYYYGMNFCDAPSVDEEDWSNLPLLQEDYYQAIRGEGDRLQLALK